MNLNKNAIKIHQIEEKNVYEKLKIIKTDSGSMGWYLEVWHKRLSLNHFVLVSLMIICLNDLPTVGYYRVSSSKYENLTQNMPMFQIIWKVV